MKRLILVSLMILSGLSSVVFAKGPRQYLDVYDFAKGVDTYHSSLSLPDGFVQNSNNVFFDAIAPISKRQGFTVTWSTKSYSYTGLWTYTDASNTTWQIARSSDQITANNLAGTTVLVATVSANNLIGEANAFGNIYFVDQTQGVYFWNGTSTTYVTGSPKGSILNQFHNRLWVAGLSVPNGNQLYGSKFYDGTIWATGFLDTDPVQYSIGLNDNFDNLTAEYVYLDTLYLFKHYTIFALYGFGQSTFQISQLTQECGCIDGNTIQTFNGGLKFMSLRGVEDFDGYHCKRISDPVKNKIDPAIQTGSFAQQSWVQTSDADFNSGISSNTTIANGSVFISSNNMNALNSNDNSDFESFGVSNAPPGWTESGTGTIQLWASGANNIYFNCNGNAIHGSRYLESVNPYTTDVWTVAIVDASSSSNTIVSTTMTKDYSCAWTTYTFTASAITTTTSTVRIRFEKTGLDGFSNPFDSKIYSSTFTISNDVTLRWASAHYSTGSDEVAMFDYITGGSNTITSGSYYSSVHNILTMNTWGNFNVTDVLNGGLITYYARSSTNSFSSSSSTPSWTTQTKNSQLIISTGTYFQMGSTFTITSTSGSQTPTLNDFTFQWYTGKNPTPMSSTVWDNRYWLSLTTATTDTANDGILVLSNSGAWSVLDIHAGALTQTKGVLYHADSNATGNIYQDNQGYADNGAAINSFIMTRDYSFGQLPADDYLYALYPSADNTGSCAMTFNYETDRGSTTYNLGSPLLSEFSSFSAVRLPLPIDSSHQDFGQSFNFTIGTNDASCAWNFYGFQGVYKSRPVN